MLKKKKKKKKKEKKREREREKIHKGNHGSKDLKK
jgi:hypothetical protein